MISAIPRSVVLAGDGETLAALLWAGIDRSGSVSTVDLVGLPGAGKTTTLDAVGRALTTRGCDVRRVGSDESSAGLPFGAVSGLLGLDRAFPPRPGTGDRAMHVLEELCQHGPVALCLDDAHRADPDSLTVLTRFAALARDLPLALVVARRPAPERAALTVLASRADAHRAEVVGLDGPATRALVRARYGAPPDEAMRSLLGTTRGNPFQITALLDELDRRAMVTVTDGRARVEPGDVAAASSVAASVRGHLALLDRADRELLQVLAVWGTPAPLPTLAALVGAVPAYFVRSAQTAVGAGVLQWVAGAGVAFRHDLYRDVVLGDIEPPVLRALHASCATLLQRRGAAAPTVAHHLSAAGSPEAAAVLHTAVTELEHAPAGAAALLAAAAENAGTDEEADAVAVERAGALAIGGDVVEAERVARERLATSRDPDTHAALRAIVLFGLVSGAHVDAALAEIDDLASRAGTPGGRDELADVRRWVRLLAGRDPVAGPPATVARSGSGLVSDALQLYLVARCDEGYERAVLATTTRSYDTSRPWLDSPSADVWPAFIAITSLGPRRAREISVAARRALQHDGRLWLTPYQQFVSGSINYHSGMWDDAVAEIESGLEAARSTGTAWISLATAAILQIQVRRGELEAAATGTRRWQARGLPEQFGLPQVAHAEALLLEAREQLTDAAQLVRRSWERTVGRGRSVWALLAGPDAIRIATTAGDAALVARIAGDTSRTPVDQATALAPGALLVAAVAAGDDGAAARAAVAYRAVGNLVGEVAAWEEAACLAAARGQFEQARVSARRCTELAASLGAVTIERRLAARLRRLDVSLGARGTRGRPSSGWESLTPTELQVAALVAQGLTSPQIAARLFVSPRTVQTHISNMLRKLDLRSRVELATTTSRHQRP